MNTKVLKTFLTICRVGSITKAAQLLYISQPALSRQIQDLEEELGCKLFDRSKRQLALTESGFLIQQRAQEILNLDERTKKELRENAGFLSGELRIGCVESSAVRFLADKFQAFRATYPQVQFELYSADGDDIRSALDHDRIDMGILLEPVEAAKYDAIDLPVADRWGIVVREDNPVASKTFADGQTISSSRDPAAPCDCAKRNQNVVFRSCQGRECRDVPQPSEFVAAFHRFGNRRRPFVRGGRLQHPSLVRPSVRAACAGTFGASQIRAAQKSPTFQGRRNFLVSTAKSRSLISCEICMKNH